MFEDQAATTDTSQDKKLVGDQYSTIDHFQDGGQRDTAARSHSLDWYASVKIAEDLAYMHQAD
ncbi:MAG: hypothetical protein B7Z11_04880 [Acidovorax sp. 32-64-7]|nr:hypothetical protein CBP35_17255 [Acidovorax carolinensis]OYX11312.1 MAG: hypothetical protein B7Z11_04880 [Acidovorax sp. 32-64-7]